MKNFKRSKTKTSKAKTSKTKTPEYLLDETVCFRLFPDSLSQLTNTGHDSKGAKPLPPGTIIAQKPNPRDITLENFTNVTINSHTI